MLRPALAPLRSALLTLHSALLAAAALVLAALGVVTQLTLDHEYRSEVQRALGEADRSTQKLAVRVSEVLDRINQNTLLVKSLHDAGKPTELAALRDAGLVTLDTTRALVVTDARGFVNESTSPDVALNLADEDDFKRHQRDAELGLTIGVPQPDHLHGGWMIPATRRLSRADRFDGVVVAMVDPASLTKGFGEGEAAGTAIGIFGLDGVYRSRLLDAQQSSGARIDPQKLLQRARAIRETLQPSVSQVDGHKRFFSAQQLDRYPLVATVAISADTVMARYAQTRQRILGWAGAMAALVILGAAVLWQQARRLGASRQEERRAKALYAATLEGSLDALWMMRAERDAQGVAVDFRITDANSRAAAVLGVPRRALVGRLATELVPSIRHDGLLKLLLTVLERQQPMDVEAQAVAAPVAGRWMHFQVVPVDDGVALITRDIDARKRAEQQLAERESFFRTLLDVLPLSVTAKSARSGRFGTYLYWNPAAERTFGVAAAQAVGHRSADFLPTELAKRLAAQDEAVMDRDGVLHDPDVVFQRAPGEAPRCLSVTKAPVRGTDGEIDHILVIAEDVTERRAIADRLRLASRVVDETGDAVVLTDRDDRIVEANAAFLAMTGQPLAGLVGRTAASAGLPPLTNTALPGVAFALGAHRRWSGESWQRRADGGGFETWLNVTAITDEQGRVTHYARLFSDISRLKAQERQLADLARRDALTGLSNRRNFEEQLEQAVARAQRSGRPLALLYLDLDGFKRVNDTLGHDVGDQLLVGVARRLEQGVRQTDLVSRLGGDEFTVLLEDSGTDADRTRQCERLLAALSEPHDLAGQPVVSTPSIGLAVHVPGESLDSLRKRADAAMYEAKRAGKARLRVAPAAPLAA